MESIQSDTDTQPFLEFLLCTPHQEGVGTPDIYKVEWSWPENIGENARECMLSHTLAARARSEDGCRRKIGWLSPEQEQAVIHASQNLINKREFQSAEQLVSTAILASGDPRLLITELVRGYEKANQPQKTLKATSLLSIAFPNISEIRFLHALALRTLGRSDEAMEVILPDLITTQSVTLKRLYALLLSDIGAHLDAISAWQSVLEEYPEDHESKRALVNKYIQVADYDRALNLISTIQGNNRTELDNIQECLVLRHLGELDKSILAADQIIKTDQTSRDGFWVQCFNYGISTAKNSARMLRHAKTLWKLQRGEKAPTYITEIPEQSNANQKIKVGILSADIGDHVVARFIKPILRTHNTDLLHIEILCTKRKYDEMAEGFKDLCNEIISLEGLDPLAAQELITSRKYDVIVETGGFTNNSGLGLLSKRCAPIQCHYIGYHASTGLDTIDYFIGDQITCSHDLKSQFSENIIQLPVPWISYDNKIPFPNAYTTSKREGPVLGCFCQISKIGKETLSFWTEALHASQDAILVIKDRGTRSERFRARIEAHFRKCNISTSRLFYIGAVASHLEHLACYNAIDIALDTTPWSSATTAFEALGMGVPLVSIYGDTTSGRMSASVATAAGMPDLIARSPQEFGRITSRLAQDYEDIRLSKPYLQRSIRASCLFDDRRAGENFDQAIRLIASKVPLT